MSVPKHRYLTAKRRVDDRAIDRRVWGRFEDSFTSRTDPLRIVEIGAGVGTMIARLAEWNALPADVSTVRYTLVDRDGDCLEVARARLPGWLAADGWTVEETTDGLLATTDAPDAPNRLHVAFDRSDGLTLSRDADVDVVVAAALLDILDLDRALERFTSLLSPGGVLYAPLTFDGVTTFLPADPRDERIERAYHHHMDHARDEPGSSTAGRRLVGSLADSAFETLAVGSSEWVLRPRDRRSRSSSAVPSELCSCDDGSTVHPTDSDSCPTTTWTAGDDPGAYPPADRRVLAALLGTIGDALEDLPADEIEPDVRRRWLTRRRAELSGGRLSALVRHLDVLARLDEPGDSSESGHHPDSASVYRP